MDLNRKLSPHFTLKEMLFTQHREIDNTPSDEDVANLTLLCNNLLEPIRNMFGPLRVNSGYRSFALNKAIGGSKTSAHCHGCAADIDPLVPEISTRNIVLWIKSSNLLYDQCIDEYAGPNNWTHVGMARPARKQVLLYSKGVYSIFQ